MPMMQPYGNDTRTRKRRRKPVPENCYRKPKRKYRMFYMSPETNTREIW